MKNLISFILGIGDWGLGIGDWGLGPIPNPQSPIPNPHFQNCLKADKNKILILLNLFILISYMNTNLKLKKIIVVKRIHYYYYLQKFFL